MNGRHLNELRAELSQAERLLENVQKAEEYPALNHEVKGSIKKLLEEPGAYLEDRAIKLKKQIADEESSQKLPPLERIGEVLGHFGTFGITIGMMSSYYAEVGGCSYLSGGETMPCIASADDPTEAVTKLYLLLKRIDRIIFQDGRYFKLDEYDRWQEVSL